MGIVSRNLATTSNFVQFRDSRNFTFFKAPRVVRDTWCIRVAQGETHVKWRAGQTVRPEKFQFLEKWQNRNFGYKIVISIKNPKFIL